MLTACLPELREALRVTFPRHNRPQHRQAGSSGDVRQDEIKLNVHVLQCLDHMIDMRGTPFNQLCSIAHQGPQRANLGVRAERALE